MCAKCVFFHAGVVVAVAMLLMGVVMAPRVLAVSQTWYLTDDVASGPFVQGGTAGDRYMKKVFPGGEPDSVVFQGNQDAYWYAAESTSMDLSFSNEGWGTAINWSASGHGNRGWLTVEIVKAFWNSILAELGLPILA